MFILGLLAFLQTVFIPGFIILNYLDVTTGNGKISKIQKLVYGFGLSLLINYLLVFLFVTLGIYRPLTMYIVLFIEGIWLLYLIKKSSRVSLYFELNINEAVNRFKRFMDSHSLHYNILLFLSFAVILVYVLYFFYFLGTVFIHWDPAIAWNRFAGEWAANQIPVNTWRYPQLIPANWSVSYVLMQTTEVQCFAKAIMPLFSIGILLLFLDLGLRRKRAVHLLALIFFGIILGYLYDPSYIVSGYVDIAVSFFAFLSFHVLYSFWEKTGSPGFKTTWLAVVFASAAAVTKQSGLFMLAVILVWALTSLTKNSQKFLRGARGPTAWGDYMRRLCCAMFGAILPAKRHELKAIPKSPPNRESAPRTRRRQDIFIAVLLLLLTVLIITASWYMLKEIQISKGIDRSEIRMVQSVHRSDSHTERLTRGVREILERRHPLLEYLVYAAVLLILLGLFHKESRKVTLFIVIPYSLMWGFFFSYDFRNLSPAIPFMGFSAAFGIVFLKKLLPGPGKCPKFKLSVIPLVIATLAVLAVMNAAVFKKETLIHHQNLQKMKMGDYQLNDMLYRFHEKEGINGKIATNYAYLKLLPGLKKFYFKKSGRITLEFLDYLDSEEGKEIHYLLMPVVIKSEKEILQRSREKIKNKEYRVIFKCKGYCFIQVRKISGQ